MLRSQNGNRHQQWEAALEAAKKIAAALSPRFLKLFPLRQNFPNPFNPSTIIEFSMPTSQFATLKIYNTLGAEIATLFERRIEAGTHRIEWTPVGLASGVYFYSLEAGEFRQSKKLLLLK